MVVSEFAKDGRTILEVEHITVSEDPLGSVNFWVPAAMTGSDLSLPANLTVLFSDMDSLCAPSVAVTSGTAMPMAVE